MIVRSGLDLSIPVLFSAGRPDGNVSWRLYDGSGTQMATGSAVVPVDAVSMNLLAAAVHNTLAPGVLFASRDFEWTYTVSGAVVNGLQRYSVEARPPFGISSDGVRSKLGVEPRDLPDSDVPLIRAYLAFRELVTPALLTAVTDDGVLLAVRDAIEARAALDLIPSMSIRVAAYEDSGTNAFKRQAIDWEAIAEHLSALFNDGVLSVNPAYDPSPIGALFVLATPTTDPITGGSYASA